MPMVKRVVRSAYNYDPEVNSDASAFSDDTESRAHQSFKDECDINTIVRRFGITGELPSNVRVPQYADFEETFDFMTSMNVIRDAQEAFMAMPSAVRDRFGHDPARFVDFFNDPDNRPEAEKLGIVTRRPVADPTPAPGVSGAPAPFPGPTGPSTGAPAGVPGTSST